MQQDLSNLFVLQQLDLAIRIAEANKLVIPQQLAKRLAELGSQRDAIDKLSQQAELLEQESRTLYQTVESERDKVRKWEARLGDIRNQREFQALQRETEGQKRANRDTEEKIQELNRQHEQLTAELVQKREALDIFASSVKKQQKEVQSQLDVIETELSKQQTQRESLQDRVPRQLYRKYETIRAKRADIGLCIIDGGACVSCNMRLPPQLYNILQRDNSIEQCPSCSRIMVWKQALPQDHQGHDEPEPKVEEAPTKARAARKNTVAQTAV